MIPRDECPVVVFDRNESNYKIMTEVAGMVFDDALHYTLQLSSEHFENHDQRLITQPKGYFHISQQGANPQTPMGNVEDHFPEMLGAGKYKFTFSPLNPGQDEAPFTVTLDLTDANWALGQSGSFRNILFGEPQFRKDAEDGYVEVFISVDSPMSTDLIYCDEYYHEAEIMYWELVRHHGTAMYYQRDRYEFVIDPYYIGPDPFGTPNTANIPYGVDYAELDVHVYIEGDLVIPGGKQFVVTTDPDGINSPSFEETHVMFAEDLGLTIEDGGTLQSTHAGPFGVVDYFCFRSTEKGAWQGIIGEPGASVDIAAATITHAVVGLTLDDPASAVLSVCLIEKSRDIGLHIRNSQSYGTPVEVAISSISLTGGYTGTFRTRNVLIENCEDAPSFYMTGMSDAVKNSDGGSFYGGHGVEVVGSSEVRFEDCTIRTNDSCGLFIHHTFGPKIVASAIFDNGKGLSGQGGPVGAGIFIEETASWTTLRSSRVYSNNAAGIHLSGSSTDDITAVRGWYHEDPLIDPNNPGDVDQITKRNGENCIYQNTKNIWSARYGRFDLGTEYIDGGGVMVTLGGYNTIVDPVMLQGTLDNYSFGGFRRNWWNGDNQIWTYNGSVVDIDQELLGDSLNCFEMGKRGMSAPDELVREMLTYYRTRGHMQAAQPPATHARVQSRQSESCVIESVYPNPFNPQARIAVRLAEAQDIRLSITDMLGREVDVPANGYHEAGRYVFTFDAGTLPSGMYIAVLRGASSIRTQTLLLAR